MIRKKLFLFCSSILCYAAFLGWFPSAAQANEILTADEIARQVFDRDRGHSSHSKAVMVLINKNGYKRNRIFTTTRKLTDGLEKQMIRFLSPEDIAGTGFLTIEKPGYETDQFIYLSALRRTRRIVASQKHHRFVQTDFTYEDMQRHPVENYLYTLEGQKKIGDIDCYILKTAPKPGIASQYSFTRSFISKVGFVPILAEYYDQKGKHVKIYAVLELKKIQDIMTESIIKMEDLERSHQTYIKLQHIEYNIDISEDQISKAALENY